MNTRLAGVALVASLLLPSLAHATYSAPLMRVRVDADLMTHTPSVLYASALAFSATAELDLRVTGAQYIFEKEWNSGWGLQAGLALGWAHVSTEQWGGPWQNARVAATGDGFFVGGQLRAYRMLWSGFFLDSRKAGRDRPHAITAFINLRGIFYNASGDVDGSASGAFSGAFGALSAGLGVMAEFALGNYVSLLPYAWFSPALYARNSYDIAGQERTVSKGPSVRQPIRVGVDAWVYPWGASNEDHVALSAIASLIDTEGRGNQEFSFVLGYTF
jgi:hypothetical protein